MNSEKTDGAGAGGSDEPMTEDELTVSVSLSGTYPRKIGSRRVLVKKEHGLRPFGPVPMPRKTLASVLRDIADELDPSSAVEPRRR